MERQAVSLLLNLLAQMVKKTHHVVCLIHCFPFAGLFNLCLNTTSKTLSVQQSLRHSH
jgi:glutamine synthetase type III